MDILSYILGLIVGGKVTAIELESASYVFTDQDDGDIVITEANE